MNKINLQNEDLSKFRAVLADNAINDEQKTISFLALSHNNLHKRSSFFGDEYYLSVDLSSVTFEATTLYLDHDVSFENAIGKIIDTKLDDKGFKVIVQFNDEVSQSREAYAKFKAGFSDSVSVGFKTYELKEREQIGGVEHYEIVNGVINELSAVWQGADPNAKVANFAKEQEKPKLAEQEMQKEDENTEFKAEKKDETKEIIELAEILGKHAEAIEAIKNKMSFNEFSKKIKEQQQKTNDIKEFNIMKRENTQDFSLAKIILSAGNTTADLGFEVENYFNKSNGRFILPSDFGARFSDAITTTTKAAGAISTDFRDDLLIEEVKAESPLLGECTWLDGLSQRVEIPRNNSNITADFVEEGQSRDSENLAFDKIILEPHTLLATIRITRTMMNMSAFGLESFAYKAMKFAIRKKLEEAILYGKGVIKGVFETSGVPSIAGYLTAPNLEKTLSFGDMLENNNGNIANAKFALKNSDVSKLKATQRGVSNEKMLIEELGNLQGYPYFTTQLIKSGDVVFGDFKDIFIGSFKGIELLTHNERGGDVILELYLDVDAKLAREKSFVISKTSA
ncbi:phage major capsid protein [Campylobacter sp. FOBRC14]|uniref:phage major capsid protein n=1 Tax=Campylobacter sp. FOBRC14 TaxID=936554 RepID=UPI00027A374E|nr:phage major capsid protein [Campylobacter sp. FOBRC14]EJP74236.1 phage major capsid protein, HK97 family [Campylobacter sp. FOBRC14]